MTVTTHEERLIISGFGGQGIILSGKIMAQTAMMARREVTLMPSYGAEVRGGTAHCLIIMADEPIASPLISVPRSCVVMNSASFDKFATTLAPDGLLIMNAESPQVVPDRDDIDVVAVPAERIALELGSIKIANMVMLGAYVTRTGLFTIDQLAAALPEVLSSRYHQMIPMNVQAMHKGAAWGGAKSSMRE